MQHLRVAAAVVFDSDGRVLIARRNPEKRDGGLWEFPGGKIEAGESAETCLLREWQEEFDVIISVESKLLVSHAVDSEIELHTYCATVVSGSWTLRAHSEIAWVYAQDLNRFDFPVADYPVVAYLQNHAATCS